MTGKNGPPLGVESSFPLWKEGGGVGVQGRSKKTFRPYILFRIPIPPCVGFRFGIQAVKVAFERRTCNMAR
jgi:hypothetical protein